jgi:hypothetical protein
MSRLCGAVAVLMFLLLTGAPARAADRSAWSLPLTAVPPSALEAARRQVPDGILLGAAREESDTEVAFEILILTSDGLQTVIADEVGAILTVQPAVPLDPLARYWIQTRIELGYTPVVAWPERFELQARRNSDHADLRR